MEEERTSISQLETSATINQNPMDTSINENLDSPNIFQSRNYRFLHKYFATFFVFTLLLSAITGFLYRWSRFIGYDKASVQWLMTIHEGKIIDSFPVLYTFYNLVGIGHFTFTGYFMVNNLHFCFCFSQKQRD